MADEPTLSIPEGAGHRERMIRMLRYVVECDDLGVRAQLPVTDRGTDSRNLRAADDLFKDGYMRALGSDSKVMGGRFSRLEDLRPTEQGRAWLERVSDQVVSPPAVSVASTVTALLADDPVQLTPDQQRAVEAAASSVQRFLETDPDLEPEHREVMETQLRILQSASRGANDVAQQSRALGMIRWVVTAVMAVAGSVLANIIAEQLNPVIQAAVASLGG